MRTTLGARPGTPRRPTVQTPGPAGRAWRARSDFIDVLTRITAIPHARQDVAPGLLDEHVRRHAQGSVTERRVTHPIEAAHCADGTRPLAAGCHAGRRRDLARPVTGNPPRREGMDTTEGDQSLTAPAVTPAAT